METRNGERGTRNNQDSSSGSITAPDKPGSYSYRCNIHPAKMRGVLVVVGETTPDPTKHHGSVFPIRRCPGVRVAGALVIGGR